MAWNRIANGTATISFTKTSLEDYIKVQKEHKELMEGRNNRKFNTTYLYTAFGVAAAAFGPVGVTAAVVISVANQFYANMLGDELDEVADETAKGLKKLDDIKVAYKTEYASIKVQLPVIRYKNSFNGDIVYLAAGDGVRQISATLKSGIVIES